MFFIKGHFSAFPLGSGGSHVDGLRMISVDNMVCVDSKISVESTGYVWTVYLWTVQYDICGQYNISVDSTIWYLWTVQYDICGQFTQLCCVTAQ